MILIGDIEVVVRGRLPKAASVRNEWYDFVTEPDSFIRDVRAAKLNAHFFTFLQEPHDQELKHRFHAETDSISILPISTFDHWMTKQIDAKTRNMIRKAAKKGIQLRQVDHHDKEFITGVVSIYNESPVRQGRRFWHYGMDLAGAKEHLETFAARSHYVGAYLDQELIGFFKLTRNANSASVMQIISKLAHRDRAPNNALLARAVELCAELRIPYLQYGIWSRGGLGEYKINHGFKRFDIPRYFIPLNAVGHVLLRCRLHRGAGRMIPNQVRDAFVAARTKWYARGSTLT